MFAIRSKPLLLLGVIAFCHPAAATVTLSVEAYKQDIGPLIENYCYDCHADGANKGNVAFDEFESDVEVLQHPQLWLQVLKNLRAGLMPPAKKPQPTAEEKQRIEQWIKHSVIAADPVDPDPGRVTLRRLNRVEYRNTIRDLMGVDFDVANVFPPDDTGHGFDNMGDVLTLPPLLLEKYVQAANQIVAQAVPTVPAVMREQTIALSQFRGRDQDNEDRSRNRRNQLILSYYEPAIVSNTFKANIAGEYQLSLALVLNERFVDGVFDYNKCRLITRLDGNELKREEFGWAGGKSFTYDFDVNLTRGEHELSFEIEPLTPDQQQTRSLAVQITAVKLIGPKAPEHWVGTKDYKKYFPKPIPTEVDARRAYARELLETFVRRAYRRPPEQRTMNRLVALAESVYDQPGKTFESGIAQAMVAVLASPKFLFREEQAEPAPVGSKYPFVDEYSLASRLSYFLWSSMPDDELFRLAEAGQLRKNLSAQVQRMLNDWRAEAFVRNFVGQWLRARDIETVPIEARFVLAREEQPDAELENARRRLYELRGERNKRELTPEEDKELQAALAKVRRAADQPPRVEMTGELRVAMRLETEKTFEYLIREDRSLLELLDADYTFLNERLAAHYGIPDVRGREMRLVKLPPDSPRGGVLTQGTMLGVTSNPTRTSPVKRGMFILENILGTPPPPPPPDVPPLEDATRGKKQGQLSLREALAAHREDALCRSCHNRMDPLGLAFENFNAMGMWREQEYQEPIDATGELLTGEKFTTVRELKRILVKNHYKEFYHTIAEKLLTYALGRGMEYHDVETLDQIVARLEASGGKASALIAGVVESAPFQKTRAMQQSRNEDLKLPQQVADAKSKP